MFARFLMLVLFSCCSWVTLWSEEDVGKIPKKEVKKEVVKKQKQVLLIVASDGYMDTELNGTRDKLQKAGFKVVLASSKKEAAGVLQGKEKIDVLLSDTMEQLDKFVAVVFIGGPGCQEYFQSKEAFAIAKKTLSKKKVLAAICFAPNILAEAGVLKGKKATCCGPFEKSNGIKVEDKNVVRDGLIITANGPEATEEFADTIVKTLSAKTKTRTKRR